MVIIQIIHSCINKTQYDAALILKWLVINLPQVQWSQCDVFQDRSFASIYGITNVHVVYYCRDTPSTCGFINFLFLKVAAGSKYARILNQLLITRGGTVV